MVGDEFAQVVRHGARALHVNDRTAAAALEQGLEQKHQVFGFFFDFHIAVAQDAEHARARHFVTGEETVEIERDDLFQRQEAHRLADIGKPDEPLQLRRDRNECRDDLAVLAARKPQREREAEIGNERKRMRRIDGERRQNRKNLFAEMRIEPCAVAVHHLFRLDHGDAGVAQFPAQ